LSLLTTDDEIEECRSVAAVALARFDDKETPALLENTICDSRLSAVNRMRASFAYHLSGIQRGEDVPSRLTALSLDDKRDVKERLCAVAALAYIPLIAEDSAGNVAGKLHEIVLRTPEDTLRSSAARWAFQHKPAETVARLRAELVDKGLEDDAREAAAIGLVALDAPEAKSFLEEIRADLTDVFAAGTAAFALKIGEALEKGEDFPAGEVRLIDRAFAHLSAGSTVRGLADFTQLIEGDPGTAVFYWGRSTLLRMQLRYDEALVDALKAAELPPPSASRQSNLGDIYRDLVDKIKQMIPP
jgi:hypothetical protein